MVAWIKYLLFARRKGYRIQWQRLNKYGRWENIQGRRKLPEGTYRYVRSRGRIHKISGEIRIDNA